MDHRRSATALGLAACTGVLALTALPYLVAPGRAVGVYYGTSFGGPPLVALFAVIVAIALAAGRRGRTDPALAAGISLAFGAFVGLLAVVWALGVSPSLVGGLTEVDLLEYHRWAFGLAGLLVAAAAGWYARAVL